MKQGTQEWLDARKMRVTASNVGAILGLDPFRTRDDVMRSMVRDALGAEREFKGNVATEWGTFNEKGARQQFEMETGLKVKECGFFEFEDWLGASPDGLIGDDHIVEIKCPYSLRKDDPTKFKPLSEQAHYYAQIQIQLLCANRSRAYFYQWAPFGTDMTYVQRSNSWLDENITELQRFHKSFLYDLEYHHERYLEPKRAVIDTPKAHKMIQEYDDLKEQIELAQLRQKELLADIVDLARERDAEFAGRKLTRVTREGSVSYAKAIKELAPDADLSQWRGLPTSYWKLT